MITFTIVLVRTLISKVFFFSVLTTPTGGVNHSKSANTDFHNRRRASQLASNARAGHGLLEPTVNGELFGNTPENVLVHLKIVYKDKELEEIATTKDFLVVRQE